LAAPDGDLEGQLHAALAKVAQLEIALEHRTVISQAVGILMERHQLHASVAFDALRRVSSQTNRKVFGIAQELSQTGRTEGFGAEE
jgi:AmiR/NasT family two-component response regulator